LYQGLAEPIEVFENLKKQRYPNKNSEKRGKTPLQYNRSKNFCAVMW